MKELGGYLELEKANGKVYHPDAIALNSGRACLEYLINAKNIKKLYIPYLLCNSISELCSKCRCEYEYYNITTDFQMDFNISLKENEYLYIVNYYGQIDNAKIEGYKKTFGNIIIDNAQAFFQYPYANADTLYTCRKFFGVADGGYLYTDLQIVYELKKDVSIDKMKHILGRFEKDASTFYNVYVKNENTFQYAELMNMSKLTENLLQGVDYERVKSQRKENFEYLHSILKKRNKLNLIIPDGAFMYPLYIDNGVQLKKKLIENRIYVPTLWADVFNVADKSMLEYDMAENIVPLPTDQRYNIDDMKYIIRKIEEKQT